MASSESSLAQTIGQGSAPQEVPAPITPLNPIQQAAYDAAQNAKNVVNGVYVPPVVPPPVSPPSSTPPSAVNNVGSGAAPSGGGIMGGNAPAGTTFNPNVPINTPSGVLVVAPVAGVGSTTTTSIGGGTPPAGTVFNPSTSPNQTTVVTPVVNSPPPVPIPSGGTGSGSSGSSGGSSSGSSTVVVPTQLTAGMSQDEWNVYKAANHIPDGSQYNSNSGVITLPDGTTISPISHSNASPTLTAISADGKITSINGVVLTGDYINDINSLVNSGASDADIITFLQMNPDTTWWSQNLFTPVTNRINTAVTNFNANIGSYMMVGSLIISKADFNKLSPDAQFAMYQKAGLIPVGGKISINSDGTWGVIIPTDIKYDASNAIMTKATLDYLKTNDPDVYTSYLKDGLTVTWGKYADKIINAMNTVAGVQVGIGGQTLDYNSWASSLSSDLKSVYDAKGGGVMIMGN